MVRHRAELSAGEYYHFYNRGNNRQRVFYERDNYLFFLRRLRQYLLPVLDVVAYCLMPTHYHLLVFLRQIPEDEEAGEVSKALMRLGVSYTKAMNKRYDRVGALFQGAFQAKHIEHDNYLTHLSRYIHLNPVKARLVGYAEDWEYSSYCDYIGMRKGTLPDPDIVLSQFPSAKHYRDFVESYAVHEIAIIADCLFD